METRESNLLRSVTETTWRFYLLVGVLSSIVLCGTIAYIQQLRHGLILTGMRDQVSWGLYVTNFVFFIGISHAGTLISAILRVTDTGWRRPITRMAEAITVVALCIGAPMVIIDLGRPERLLYILRYGRIQSPILWDVLSITTYLTGCLLYFYLPLIPDLGVLAERRELGAWRRRLYRALSLGWTGKPAEWALLEKAISTMAVVIIPLAVSVHTVVSWIFAMTLRPGWDSSIMGPYFVVGAIYSGTASVILSMYVLRRIFRLENYLEPVHFRNLGLLLLTFSMVYLYFNINEYLTMGYKFQGMEKILLNRLFFGELAPYFWSVQALGVFIPMLLLITVLAFQRHGKFTVPSVALASLLVVAGAWAKRYLIIIPTLSSPYLPAQRLPSEWLHYRPTWVEWAITAGGFAGFLLIYALMAKLFPVVSIWETRVGEATEAKTKPMAPIDLPGWRAIPPIGAIMIVCILASGGTALAREPRAPKQPKPTSLAVEWQSFGSGQIPPASTEQAGRDPMPSSRVFLFADRIFGPLNSRTKGGEAEKFFPTIAVKATLRDSAGVPLAFQAVEFSLKTSLGTIPYGSRPSDEMGKAQLLVRDRRYGQYPVEVSYGGDELNGPSHAEILVDFGPRPAPALPARGVLISPYATAAIGIPFLLFYGIIWVVFIYAFGYLVLWRMRKARLER